MIKVTILYPNTPGSRFDHDYYLKVHMPMSIARLGAAMQSITVERGSTPELAASSAQAYLLALAGPWANRTAEAACCIPPFPPTPGRMSALGRERRSALARRSSSAAATDRRR
jgi:hypothetical protein